MSQEQAIRRNNKGQIGPGHTLNPGGKPKSAKIISDELSKLLHKGNGVKIAQQLIQLSLNAKQESVRAKTSEMILDRMEGKPLQAIQVSQTLDENTARRLVEIGNMLQRILPSQVETIPAQLIESSEQGTSTSFSSDIAPVENAPVKRKYVRSGKYAKGSKLVNSNAVKTGEISTPSSTETA